MFGLQDRPVLVVLSKELVVNTLSHVLNVQ